MAENLYVYATKINYILINSKFQVFFDAKGKSYTIYKDGSDILLESEDSDTCKLQHFVVDTNSISVTTIGECKELVSQGWTLINKNKK